MFTRNGVHSDHIPTMITLRTNTQPSLNHSRTGNMHKEEQTTKLCVSFNSRVWGIHLL